MWRSTPTAWLLLTDLTRFGWEADGFPIWNNEASPDDISELLLTENLDIEDDDDLDLDENIDDSSDERSSRPDAFCQKGVLRNFAKFTGKHLCQSLFFNKVAGGLQLY